MILVNPITGGEVEAFTDEAIKHLTSNGFTPKLEIKEKPKKRATTRKRTVKTKG